MTTRVHLLESQTFEAGRALLYELRADPAWATYKHLFRRIGKLEQVRAPALPADLLDDVAPKVLQVYRQRSAVEAPSELRRHSEPGGMMPLAAFCHRRRGEPRSPHT